MSQQDGETSEDIDGFRYRVLMLDPLTAADIIADLGFILAPVIGPLSGVLAKEKGDLLSKVMDGFDEEDESGLDVALEKAILGFFDRFTKVKQRELFTLMAKQTVVLMDGKEPMLQSIFDAHFRGRLKAMYRWFAFAMRTQFKDFFTGQGAAMSRVLDRAMAKAS